MSSGQDADRQSVATERRSLDEDSLYPEGISAERLAFDRRVTNVVDALALAVNRRWLFIFNLANAVVFFGAFLVPYLKYLGMEGAANPLFSAYRIICVQNPDHSYFIFGHQMAMDQRMTAIFGASVLAGLVFGVVRQRATPLNWRLYLLLILPMAIDGTTQLFGWRHSNWELRTLTGGLFGAATIWLAYPYLELSARRTRRDWEVVDP